MNRRAFFTGLFACAAVKACPKGLLPPGGLTCDELMATRARLMCGVEHFRADYPALPHEAYYKLTACERAFIPEERRAMWNVYDEYGQRYTSSLYRYES